MGLLSSILTVGGGIVGGMVGGPAGAKIGSALGGIAGGAIQSGSSNKASQQLVNAQNQARADRERALAETRAIQSPYMQAGEVGMNALTGRLDLPTQGAGTKPAGGNAGTSPGMIDMEQQSDGSWAAPAGLDPVAQGITGNGGGPQGAATNALTGNPAPSGGTYGNTANPTYNEPAPYAAPAPPPSYQASSEPPTYTAPAEYKYGLDDYTASPGYQYRMDQQLKGVLATASATGALQSGAALKELSDRASQVAYQDFGNERAFDFNRYTDQRDFGYGAYRDQRGDYEDERDFGYGASRDQRRDYEDTRNFGYGQSVDDRNYGRATYENDRNYLTSRYDRGTDDLFRYTGIGQQAAGVVTGAVNNNGAAQAGISENIGDAKAGNSLQQGSIWSGLTTNLAGLGANYLNGRGLSSDLAAGAAKNPYLF